MGQIEEELKMTKEQLGLARKQRDQALDELREMKMVARETDMKLSNDLPIRKLAEEVSNAKIESNAKEKTINSLKLELEKAKRYETKLSERDVLFDELKEELSKSKASETHAIGLLSVSRRRIQELEDELERGKMSEANMFESVVSQTKQLEETKIELEESKIEVISLREKLDSRNENLDSTKEAFESMRIELQLAKDGKEEALLKATSLLEEVNSLKSELNLAFEAEEKSKKAMDDLALALKEVATEANLAKEKLISTELELDHIKQESEQLKDMVRCTEETYRKLLDEAKKEAEKCKNTIERLRLEAEESLLAWNDKEVEFVNCIKEAEDKMNIVQQENMRLVEALQEAENKADAAKDEYFKLRGILKQAINEANVAKEASGIARVENLQLMDSMAEKDMALELLTRENERLKINEVASTETIRESKSLPVMMDSKTDEKNQVGRSKSKKATPKEVESGKNLNKALSFDLSELKVSNESKRLNEKVGDKKSSTSGDLEVLRGYAFKEAENDKNSVKKKRALLHRFGNLLKKKS